MSERDPAEEIAALRAELAAERAKGAAFAELNHELRTLIAGVSGLTGLLLETELTAEQRDYLKRVRGFSEALVGLVNNVLDFSRMEAGRLELERADVDLRRLADEVGELCADRARAKGVELVTSVANDLPALRGDPTRLRQVLLNLVSNALKFTDRGEVVLRVEGGGTAGARAEIRVEVRDTGIGISPEGQGRLFRPFSQVHAGDVGQFGAGSGLGLALSKQIVLAMDGTIGVTSEPGRGSTFHVTVMLERRAAVADRSAIPRVDMAGRRVLGAVPNASSRACLAEMMAPLGLAVASAVDAESAVAALRAAGEGYDVLLLDAGLPGASELMRALDGDEALATLPVVLLAYPGQRWEEPGDGSASDAGAVTAGGARPRSPITMGGSSSRPSARSSARASTRVVAGLAKPVRQTHLHACLFTLMGSAVETVTGSTMSASMSAPTAAAPAANGAPESRRGGPPSRRTGSARLSSAEAARAVTPGGLAASRGVTPVPAPVLTPALGARPRVLLVEDNSVNQRVGKLMMEKRGYAVEVAGDGYEAVEATARTAFAAVLMDCHMPRLDGYSATLEIRRRDAAPGVQSGVHAGAPPRARVPIIAMTANAGPGARERCLAAGMDDYIAKPVTAEALDEVLRRWVPGASAPPPAPPPVRRPSSPTVDLGMLRKLRTTQSPGEPDIVTEVIALFLQDAPARVAAIREAVARGDLAVAIRAAHTLKGSAGHLGAKTLAALCSRFEEKVRGGAPFNVSFAVGAIAEELDRVSAALVEERRGGQPDTAPSSRAPRSH